MIIRALRLRHGRYAIARSTLPGPSFTSQRRYASQIETDQSRDAEATITASDVSHSNIIDQPSIPEPAPFALNDPKHPVALDYAFFKHQRSRLDRLGARPGPQYKPHHVLSNPPSPKDITLELLIASQSHLGHSTSLWHPANAQYIFGIRGEHDPIHIISPDVTAAHLRRASRVVSGVTERGGLVLFVGTRTGQSQAVVRAAQLSQGCHLFTKWIPGTITNGQQILGTCATRVLNEHDQEIPGFEDQLLSQAVLRPDLVVCLNPLENYILLHECGLNNIPTIGIIDTDANPTWVTYPIAANDDSLRCVQLIAGVLGRAGEDGQKRRMQNAKDGAIGYAARHKLQPPAVNQVIKGGAGGAVDGQQGKRGQNKASPALHAVYEELRTMYERADAGGKGEEVETEVGEVSAEDQALLDAAEQAAAGSEEKVEESGDEFPDRVPT